MTRRENSGFSLVEVMVSVGVLGIGLVGLINLHTYSIVNLNRAQHIAMAQEVAMQETEFLQTEATSATGSLESVLPNCPVSRATDPTGCLDDTKAFAPLKACTVFLTDPNVPDPNGSFTAVVAPGASSSSSYRMDTVIRQHPDSLNRSSALVVTVSVCWSDDQQNYQLSINRVIVPGA